ncbi:MAG: hypothetical protein M1816_001021 [Peltula sp. TS41687]|nr:MAG: hypothetical protein M1816_001021 [Peltula sp. TS41687]
MIFTNIVPLIALAALLPGAHGHSWVEQLMVIGPDGTFVGEPGYPRGNVRRGTAGFGDPAMVHLLPPNGRAASDGILPTDPMCKESQAKPNQSEGSPALQATAGSMIALRFQENGHVTLPDNQAGKPKNRGNVYIYGTTDPKPEDTLLGIHNVWTADGSGGDKRGKLLATQAFDDGQCYQINGGEISKKRQGDFPHAPSELMGGDLWCQNDIKLPSEATAGKPYTLYWVWDWPTAPNVDPGLPKGKAETYTTCMDIEVTDNIPSIKKAAADNTSADKGDKKDIGNMAVPSLFGQLQSGGSSSSPSTSPSPSSSSPSSAPASSSPAQQSPAPTSSQSPVQQPPTPRSSESPAQQLPDSDSPASSFGATVTVTQTKGKPRPTPSTCLCVPLEKRSVDVPVSILTVTEKETVTVMATATIYATGTTLARQSNPTAVSEAKVIDEESESPESSTTKAPCASKAHGQHGRRWAAGRFR